jgi:hypothetical protein
MTLPEFLRETQAAVRSQMRDGALYEELVFCGIVMDHMSEIGMTFEPVECHLRRQGGQREPAPERLFAVGGKRSARPVREPLRQRG